MSPASSKFPPPCSATVHLLASGTSGALSGFIALWLWPNVWWLGSLLLVVPRRPWQPPILPIPILERLELVTNLVVTVGVVAVLTAYLGLGGLWLLLPAYQEHHERWLVGYLLFAWNVWPLLFVTEDYIQPWLAMVLANTEIVWMASGGVIGVIVTKVLIGRVPAG